MVRIALGIPTRQNEWPIYFATSVMGMSKPANTLLISEVGKPIDVARNRIVERALENEDVTHVLFMDGDMTFPRGTLTALFRTELPLVSGTYFSRTDHPLPHAYKFVKQDENGNDLYYPHGDKLAAFLNRHWDDVRKEPDVGILPEWEDRLEPVDALGGGCLLVAREVFEAIGYPWFVAYHDTGGGEDFWFCQEARKAGFQPYVDWSVRCGHELPLQFQTVEDFTGFFGVHTDDEHDWSLDGFEVVITPGGWVRRAGKAVVDKVTGKR